MGTAGAQRRSDQARAAVSLRRPPVGLYVHLPWCASKCPYCDFNSHALAGELPEVQYRQALLRDLEYEFSRAPSEPVRSVFFGGGTPSLFSGSTIEAVLGWLDDRGLIEPHAEVTLEANPGTVERGSFADYAGAGVNRISLGVQSFSKSSLTALGRIHGPGEAWRAIEEVHGAGITRLNLDLLFGLPGQTEEEALRDLDRALDAGPSHVSHYQLTLEPNTLFAVRPPRLPSEETIWRSSLVCQARLQEAGFRRYEVSAYALDGDECRHNLNYWRFGDYVGVGAGAHGKRTYPEAGRIARSWKTRHPERFMSQRPPLGGQADIGEEDRIFEFMLNALRLIGGFEDRIFEDRTGLEMARVKLRLEESRDRGLVVQTEGPGWRPTELGLRFLNDLQSAFLPDAVA